MPDSGTFAFTVHPRARLREDLARAWRPLGLVPEAVYDTALRRLPLPPVTIAGVQIGGERVGHVVLVPFGARHLLADSAGGRRRVSQAVDRAASLGAAVVGLGALTATVTAGGLTLRDRTDIGVTNGNAFTAAIVEDQIRMLLPRVRECAGHPRIAIVGASGSVGTAVTKLLARDPAGARLTLIARNAARLDALAADIRDSIDVSVATSIDAALDADLVVLLTASADSLLGSEHLAPGAIVLDATQPRNTSPALAAARPDVLVVDGGIVSVPSLRLVGGEIGLPDGRAYACFAETAILALTGHRGHFSMGNPTLEQVDAIRERARSVSHLGFRAAEPTSFGRPVALEPPHGGDRMTRVVLLGGGYVTLHAYAGIVRRLGREVRDGDVEIVVISADRAHRFHGFTGELLAGMIDRDRLATPLDEVMPLARIIIGRAVDIDGEGRRVSYQLADDAPIQTLEFDHLVVGTGAKEPISEVAGMREFGFTLRGPDEISALADHLSAVPGSPVVVAGGGIAGVELAAAIVDRGHPVTLVHAAPHLLGEWSDQPRLVASAEAELDRLGVTLLAGRRLVEVSSSSARLSDGSVLASGTVLATTGQRPVRVPGLDHRRDERGRLRTHPTLAVMPGVWAAGDAARVSHPVTGAPVPANALWAIKGGDHIGRAIARELHGRRATRFTFRGLGRAASLGLGKGIAELYGIPFTGAGAWLLRFVFFLGFMPSRRRAAGVVADVARFVTRPLVAARRRSPVMGIAARA